MKFHASEIRQEDYYSIKRAVQKHERINLAFGDAEFEVDEVAACGEGYIVIPVKRHPDHRDVRIIAFLEPGISMGNIDESDEYQIALIGFSEVDEQKLLIKALASSVNSNHDIFQNKADKRDKIVNFMNLLKQDKRKLN